MLVVGLLRHDCLCFGRVWLGVLGVWFRVVVWVIWLVWLCMYWCDLVRGCCLLLGGCGCLLFWVGGLVGLWLFG